MDYKKEYYHTKYEKLKADEPGMIVSQGAVALFKLFSILMMWVSGIGITVTLILLFFCSPNSDFSFCRERGMLVLFLIVLSLLLIASIIIYVFGNKITRRNNYILELDKLAGEMVKENDGETKTETNK